MHEVGIPVFNIFDYSSPMDKAISDTIGDKGSRSFARHVVDWNNELERTQGEILAVIGKTIERLTSGVHNG